MRTFPFLFVLILQISCSSSRYVEPRNLNFYDEHVSGLSYSTKKPSSAAKVFLIAGDFTTAAFANEIIAQKNLWLERGLKPEEIACYFAMPDQTAFDYSKALYQSIASELSSCHPANIYNLRADLALAADKPHDFVYIYVSSHGVYPPYLFHPRPYDHAKWTQLEGAMNHYGLLLKGKDSGSYSTADIVQDLKLSGIEDFAVTAGKLKPLLLNFSLSTKKIIVLQGCYSGGFIATKADYREEALTTVPNVTVLTASRDDRASFGCQPGGEMTFWGNNFFASLKSNPGTPLSIDWKKVSDEAVQKTESLETKLLIPELSKSYPQFYTNPPRPENPK